MNNPLSKLMSSVPNDFYKITDRVDVKFKTFIGYSLTLPMLGFYFQSFPSDMANIILTHCFEEVFNDEPFSIENSIKDNESERSILIDAIIEYEQKVNLLPIIIGNNDALDEQAATTIDQRHTVLYNSLEELIGYLNNELLVKPHITNIDVTASLLKVFNGFSLVKPQIHNLQFINENGLLYIYI